MSTETLVNGLVEIAKEHTEQKIQHTTCMIQKLLEHEQRRRKLLGDENRVAARYLDGRVEAIRDVLLMIEED